MRLYFIFKRAMDVLVSIIAIILLLPLLLFLAIAIRVESRGPVLFKQERYGRYKEPFNMYKFRTMYQDAPQNAPTYSIEDPDRYITKMGRFLRRRSLDELPQLWNILKGEMSFVGPRPVVLTEWELVAERDKYGANDIRPGLTGLAQINGRDMINTETKAKIDGTYVKEMSFTSDLVCLFKTIPVILNQDGYVEGGTGTSVHQETAVTEKVN